MSPRLPPRAGGFHRAPPRRPALRVCSASIGKSSYCAFGVAIRILGFWRRAMRRVISLYLPRWPSDRLRRKGKDPLPRDKPLVTAIMEGQRRVVASIDEAAEKLGLACGMTVTHA